MPLLFQLVIVLVACAGFAVAFYIGYKKRKSEKMICLLNASCETVVHSEYSRFLGIPLEYLGMIYYGLTALNYLFLVFNPSLRLSGTSYFFGALSLAAFLFSIYLTLIQAIKLKEWCTWCLVSALCSSAIFLAVLGLWSA